MVASCSVSGLSFVSSAAWIFLAWERIGLALGLSTDGEGSRCKKQDHNFTVTGSKAVSDIDISLPELMALCLSENDRRFSGYDARLVRPTTMPNLTRFALRFMRKAPAPAKVAA